MLSNLEIRNNLKVLGIISQGQLSKKMNLEYWWQRKYSEIQLSKNKNRQNKLNKLILINQAKDLLDKYDINYLKNVFKETKNFKNKNQNLKASRNKKITSNYSESSTKREDFNGNSTYNSRKNNTNNWDPSQSWWLYAICIGAVKLIVKFIQNNS